jgi:NAD(P)H-nitrite reductase large subunit
VAADLVLISTGITPNIDLARAAGLTVNRGIVVDQYLRASAPNIFAAGDAAEFEQCVYGLIPPAMDQARAAAANMVTDQKVVYAGTLPAATLKIVGLELTSLGEATAAGAPDEIVRYAEPAAKRYRRLVLRDNIIVGAILLNDRPNLTPLRQLITSRRDISAHKTHLAEPDFNFKALL